MYDGGKGLAFTLGSTISGQWGSRGIEWRGSANIVEGRLILASETVNDWFFTVVDDEKDEEIRDCHATFALQIVGDGSRGVLLAKGSRGFVAEGFCWKLVARNSFV
ncbi:MAG: hypothetical protein JW839_17260 [Candidatus Lokiarchaeota archaeon]|nr:hypothetical protein [Candidatus Lokiarchaeota archaeon]